MAWLIICITLTRWKDVQLVNHFWMCLWERLWTELPTEPETEHRRPAFIGVDRHHAKCKAKNRRRWICFSLFELSDLPSSVPRYPNSWLLRIQSLVLNSSRLYHNILFLRPLASEAYHWHYQDFISWMVDNGTSKTPRCYCTMLLLKDSCLKIKFVCLSSIYHHPSTHSFYVYECFSVCVLHACIIPRKVRSSGTEVMDGCEPLWLY